MACQGTPDRTCISKVTFTYQKNGETQVVAVSSDSIGRSGRPLWKLEAGLSRPAHDVATHSSCPLGAEDLLAVPGGIATPGPRAGRCSVSCKRRAARCLPAHLPSPSRSWRFSFAVTVGVYGEVMESGGPPDEVRYDLDESLDLLAALEDARDALADTDHLAVLAQLEHQIAGLSRKLGFDHPSGGGDGH